MITLVGLAVHPVKSTAVRHVDQAHVAPWGLHDDRRWMVVDPTGECVTAREHASLLGIQAMTPMTDPGLPVPLRLSAPGAAPLDVEQPHGDPVTVTVHGRSLDAVCAPFVATTWLAATLGIEGLRLVLVHRPRPLNPEYGLPGEATAFADG